MVEVKGNAAMHPNCDAVSAILQAAGLTGPVRMLDEAVTTAQAAAQHLGCPVGAIANSLIFETFPSASFGRRERLTETGAGTPLLIMTSGAHRVDMTAVGDQLDMQLRRACLIARSARCVSRFEAASFVVVPRRCSVSARSSSPRRRAKRSPAFVREYTGQPIGGVAPVGHPKPVRTIVDRALAEFDVLWAAGGIPHAVFPLTYAELIVLTGGMEADVG